MFDTGDPKVILNKLKEFNQKSGDGNGNLEEAKLEAVIQICSANLDNPEYYDILFKLLDWSDGNKNVFVMKLHNSSVISF